MRKLSHREVKYPKVLQLKVTEPDFKLKKLVSIVSAFK